MVGGHTRPPATDINSDGEMNSTIYKNPSDFLDVCQAAFEAHEAVYNLMLGISIRLVKDPLFYGSQPLLATVIDGNELHLAALMTPPYKLQLARFNAGSPDSIKLLASELHGSGWHVPGVMGEEKTARLFASHWSEMAGATINEGMRQRIYELREVNPIGYPEGSFTQAEIKDLDLVIKWGHAFHEDCFGDTEHPEIDNSQIRAVVENGNLFFWNDPEPVSMAALTRPTPHGISVSFVYTPPELRRKGYASAVVAKLSQRCLESGKEFCTLFTDLSNPTSNSIYRRIGYKAVADLMDIHFGYHQDL